MAMRRRQGISRIDSPQKKMHGWHVRVRLNNETRSKFFSDNLHGGKEAALAKAVECRNQLEREMGKPRTDWVVVGQNPRNTTGVVGVRRAVKKHKRSEEHTSELQSRQYLVCRLLLEKKNVSSLVQLAIVRT